MKKCISVYTIRNHYMSITDNYYQYLAPGLVESEKITEDKLHSL